uniref:ATP synthase subunit alpha, mitochondrial n=1 Tax=Bursaphelenchus xylophilus TaxID=6326 RepID=A0A1I7SNA6_BURXY
MVRFLPLGQVRHFLNRAPPNGVYMTLLERIQNWREYYDSTVKMSKWFANPEVYELTNLQLPHPAEFTKNAAFYIQNTNEFVDLPRPISLKQLFVGGVGITKAKALSEVSNSKSFNSTESDSRM